MSISGWEWVTGEVVSHQWDRNRFPHSLVNVGCRMTCTRYNRSCGCSNTVGASRIRKGTSATPARPRMERFEKWRQWSEVNDIRLRRSRIFETATTQRDYRPIFSRFHSEDLKCYFFYYANFKRGSTIRCCDISTSDIASFWRAPETNFTRIEARKSAIKFQSKDIHTDLLDLNVGILENVVVQLQ